MPKNPLKFGRRKSSGNAFEDIPEPTVPAQSSFRVIDRSEKINLNGPDRRSADPLRQVNRPFNSPLVNLRGKSTDELSSGLNRGSGGTTASGSSGYYESSSASARHSSSSTLPSSVEAEKEPDAEELFPRKARTTPMYHTLASSSNEPPAPPPSFSARAARALSFGQKNVKNGAITTNGLPPLPNVAPRYTERSSSPHRERALTTSSYASTAKPEVNLNIGTSDFGGDFATDFGNMFETPKNDRYNSPLPPTPPVAAFHRTESEPMFPPRAQSRDNFKSDTLKVSRDDSSSPYSYDRRNSREGLMSSHSPLGSPKLDNDAPPPPRHSAGIAPAFLGKSKSGYALVPERHSPTLPEPSSPYSQDSFMSDQSKEKDEVYRSNQGQLNDDRWASKEMGPHDPLYSRSSTSLVSDSPKIVTRLPTGHPASSQATAGASRSGRLSPGSSQESVGSLWGSESINTTPRAAKLELSRHIQDDSLFDSSPLGPPSRAIRPQHDRTESGTPKKMTKAQFERLQRGAGSSTEQSEDEEHADEYDDEDDAEKAKNMTRQRRKQEANMSVYRQQMKKVTGGGPGDLPSMARPSLDRATASTPALPTQSLAGVHFGGIGGQPPADALRGKQGEDDDEDVPLGILQAHGFPSSSRPPTRQGENNADHQRRASGAGSVAGGAAGQGSLPPFARRLPADPYFGSSVVNQSNRESFGMSGTPSIHGGAPMMPQQPPSGGHPGGLVGVIAGEERAKAARRGSPNPATGAFNNPQMPLPSNMPQMPGMPGMNRTMTMGSMQMPQVYTPSGMGSNGMMLPQMPMTPGMPGMPMMPQMPMMQSPQQQQPNDQMQQFMQMQMQLMQNMMAMQQAQMEQTPPPQQQQAPDYLSAGMHGRRQSIVSQAPSMRGPAANQGRSMTMMHPPTRWDLPQGGPRPNSAMPSTYAPSGMNMNHDGPGPGYSPSIAPSERSNIGMPSRYRPVAMGTDGSGRSQTMTSANTLSVYGNLNTQPNGLARPQSQHQNKPTIKLLDKPKGAPKISRKPVPTDEDDDEGWAEMRKKRDDKKKFRFGRKDKKEETSLGDLYQGYN